MIVSCFHTDDNKLSAAGVRNVCSNELDTEIDAGVTGLYWVDVDVTCDVCSVGHWRHIESPAINTGSELVCEAIIDVVVRLTVAKFVVSYTQTVEPINVCPAVIAATLQCHR